jgi:hypothetical protein
MKALSIRQPWAWFVFEDQPHARRKDVENRDWSESYANAQLSKIQKGEWFIVHAAAEVTKKEFAEAVAFARAIGCTRLPRFDELKRGGFVGIVRFEGAYRKSASPWFVGPIGLKLQASYPLPFRPARGQLGFFEVEDSL